jgi:metal-responsive CopG/Arc/MetJ family transcriptional regulator
MTRLYSSRVKTAVSIPDPIFEAADRLARRRRISRSELYAEALARLLDSDESAEVTERLDDVYGERPSELDAGLAAVQALAIDEDW